MRWTLVQLLAAGCAEEAQTRGPRTVDLPGDPVAGAVLFEEHCVDCHAPPEGNRLTACLYEEHTGWAPGELADYPLDQLVLQVVYGGECMPPMGVPLEHANGLGASPMLTREEVEDVVSYVVQTYARPL